MKTYEVRYYDFIDSVMGIKIVTIRAKDFMDAFCISESRASGRVGYEVGSIVLVKDDM
jgi:hypothetical protein